MEQPKPLNIVLLEHRQDYRAIYGINLTLYLGAKVLTAKTINESMKIIDEEDIDLIFVNNDAYGQDLAQNLFYILEKDQRELPFYVIGNTKLSRDLVTTFDVQSQLRDVIKSIAKKESITAKIMTEIEHPLFFPLPMDFIVPGWQTVVEIYIHIGDEYKVAFKRDEIIFAEQLEEQKKSGNSQLYVNRHKRLKFVNSLTLQIIAKLNNPDLSLNERMTTTEVAYQMVMEQARQIGVADSTMALANSCIDSMNIIVDSIPKLNTLLKNLMNNPGSYRYKQGLLINYIASHIIKKTKYPSKEQQEIISFVSFFHNIALTKDEYAQIHSDKQLEKSDLTDKEKDLIKKHALIAAKLVLTAEQKIPYEAGIILKQHHGSSKGLGLSNLSASISPLAIIFIFAQEWTNIILKYELDKERPHKLKIIEMLHRKYNIGGFNKILPLLHTLDF